MIYSDRTDRVKAILMRYVNAYRAGRPYGCITAHIISALLLSRAYE